VRGSSPDDEEFDPLADVPAVVRVGAAAAVCVVVGAAVVVVVFFVDFFGVVGAASGSSYWLSPAPSASAVAGTPAISSATSVDAMALLDIASLVADGHLSPSSYIALVSQERRVALVHDFLLDLRGAERVFLALCELYPDAPIFTPIYDEKGTEGSFADRDVRTSFLQKLRPTSRTFRPLLPFYPSAVEAFDLSGFDLIVSSSSAWAHAVIHDESAVHVSYCHNPFRYVWNDRDSTLAQRDPITRTALRVLFRRWRQWDWIAAQRVDRYVTNSRTTQARIRAYFGRESTVVHPPVETSRFAVGEASDYYMVLSELMPHKRIDMAVQAFNELSRPLLVVGDGPDMRRLRRIAGPTISFTGRVPDVEAAGLLSRCRALIVTAAEEFGIAAVEAQASGRPAIAPSRGGALETVRDGVTGRLWDGAAHDLARAVAEFDADAVDPQACVENARRFDTTVFAKTFPREVERAWREDQHRGSEYRRAPRPRFAWNPGRR
jgi:glycosyltransferase involved in cell wall biosynthesis